VLFQYVPHCPGDRLVTSEIRRYEDCIRTETFGMNRGHRGTDSETSRFIGGGAHNRPIASPSHYYWFTSQPRVVTLLNRGVKRVHIDMDNLTDGIRVGRRMKRCHGDQAFAN
jgi:hypothetical protein